MLVHGVRSNEKPNDFLLVQNTAISFSRTHSEFIENRTTHKIRIHTSNNNNRQKNHVKVVKIIFFVVLLEKEIIYAFQ